MIELQIKLCVFKVYLKVNLFLLRKTGETITPAPGFNVIATANTKGKGSEDGRFTAASIIDDAFLERFTVAVDQQFPRVRLRRKLYSIT